KHLRTALGRLSAVRLADSDRLHLQRLLESALHKAEEGLRARFKPVLAAALEDVGLAARDPVDRAAFDKVVEELLDRISEYGFLTFSQLRDTLSRNQLKLPDLGDPQTFIRGDPLLRLDRRLGSLLDGVYRPGEFYMRWLESLSSLNFGTPLGRALTLYVTLPPGAALVLPHLLGIVLGRCCHPRSPPATSSAVLVLRGRLPRARQTTEEELVSVYGHLAAPGAPGPLLAASSAAAHAELWPPAPPPHVAWHLSLLLATAVF